MNSDELSEFLREYRIVTVINFGDDCEKKNINLHGSGAGLIQFEI